MSELFWKDWQENLGSQTAGTQGTLRGVHIFTLLSKRVPVDAAERLLPVGGKLGPPGPDGRYLVLYTFGYQQFVRFSWSPPIFGVSYLESILAVSGVFVPGPAGKPLGPFANPGKLFLNSILAWIIGRLIGFPKRLSRISTGESSYRIRTLLADPVMSLDCQLSGKITNPFQDTNYRLFQDIARNPGITRTPFGNYLCQVLKFDQKSALAQPVQARLEVQAPDIPGLPPGIHTFTGTDAEPLTAMRARLSWIQTAVRLEEVPSGTPQPKPVQGE